MSLCQSDLQDCLEGVIPSIIATTPADGVPNVSYLSHVKEIDDRHIAQSNQFFGKTARNLRDNPQARVILVDACSGRQAQLAVTWLRDEAMTASLRASSAQVRMVDIMRLASVAAFRVDAITVILHPEGLEVQVQPVPPPRPSLERAANAIARIAAETETAGIVDAALFGACRLLDAPAVIPLQFDTERQMLVTLASHGDPRTGAGSKIVIGHGIAGALAALGRPVRVSDMRRLRRFGSAIRDASSSEESCAIPLTGMSEALSQLCHADPCQGNALR